MKLECNSKLLFSALLVFYIAVHFVDSVIGAACNSLDDRAKDYCANPVQADNIDLKWLHDNFKDGWYLQFGNSVSRKFILKLVRGDQVKKETDNELCLKSHLDFVEDHFTGYYGNKNNQAPYNCTGNSCTYTSSDKLYQEVANAYASYYNGMEIHNLVAIVLCFQNGDIGWYVLSISKTISEEETKTLIGHFNQCQSESIGFNPDLRVPFQSSSCS